MAWLRRSDIEAQSELLVVTTVRLCFAPAFTKGQMMEITREWLDGISDEQGLTRGQQKLLAIWCKEPPYVGQVIPDDVAVFLEGCRGYRGIPPHVLLFKGWIRDWT